MESHTLFFDVTIYSSEALKKAAYRLMDRCVAEISREESAYKVILKALAPKSDLGMDRLRDDFAREVLDQELRLAIKIESEPYRNLILAHVFSRTSLVKNE